MKVFPVANFYHSEEEHKKTNKHNKIRKGVRRYG